MSQSRVSGACLMGLAACWGIVILAAPCSYSQGLQRFLPGVEKSAAEGAEGKAADLGKTPDEGVTMQARLQTARDAYQTLKNELAPRIAKAQANVQAVSTALEKVTQPEDTKWLEEELHLASEWQALLESQLTLAAEEVQVAEGLLEIAQLRASLVGEKARHEEELRVKAFTPQDAKVATAEARLVTERLAVATGRLETLKDELLSLEKDAAEANLLSNRGEQQAMETAGRVAAQPPGKGRVALERELARARRHADGLQKKADVTQQQLELTQSKHELAEQEHKLLVDQAEVLEERAKAIRAAVGLSLEDLKSNEEEILAAQRQAEAERQKAEQEQARAQQEQTKAQQAVEQARLAKGQATTTAQLQVAELIQQAAEKRSELAQRKSELAKEKIEVARKAADIAQKRLVLTTTRLEVERGALSATDILSRYELAKSEAGRALKALQSSRANAELARRELETSKREAELAHLKVQAAQTQADQQPPDPLVQGTVRALEEHATVAEESTHVSEDRANILQERARLAAEMVQVSADLTQLLGMYRGTHQLWKREPSKITWGVLDEFLTDLVVVRSALIIGVSTLPATTIKLFDFLAHPSRYWERLRNVMGLAMVFLLPAVGAIWLRRTLQPLIARQQEWELPSPRQKIWRAGTRLLATVVVEMSVFLAAWLILRVAAAGAAATFLAVMTIAAAGAAAFALLRGLIQELFMPWNSNQRLINCRDGIAVFFYGHLRRISLYATVGLSVIYILQVLEYREGIVDLLRLLFDVGLLVLLTLVAANKEAIISLLPHAENRLEKLIYVVVTQVYPLLVLFLICLIALSTLGYINLTSFLAISSALTAAVLAAAHFGSSGLDAFLRWWFIARRRPDSDFVLSGEARETIYGVLTHALSYVVFLFAVVMIAGIWGVDLSGVYVTLTSETAQDYYRRLASAIIIIVISSLFLRSAYYLIDKIFDLSAAEVRAWRRRIALGDKGRTVAPLLKSLLKYGTIFVGGVLVLRAMGVDPTPIIAGAGVIGLAVGFGAQTLVKDVISGFFLLFEGVIAVGDAITFGNSGGVVEEVGLRVTKYRTFSGELWVIPNGEIRAFGNYNRQWTRAIVSVGVAYEQDVGKTMRIMEEVGKQWAEERRDIVLEAPEVQGIMSFDDSSVNLRLVIKVRPMQQWGAERQLRYRLKEAFDREGVEIPFPRQVVYTRQEGNGMAEPEAGAQEQNLSLLSTRIQKVEEAREQSGS